MKELLLRIWVYLKRGWAQIAFLASAVNFLLITYRLFVEEMPLLHSVFPSLEIYVLTVSIPGILLVAFLGWLDYRKGSYPVEFERMGKHSPWHKDVATALKLLAEGKSEEAAALLRKWV